MLEFLDSILSEPLKDLYKGLKNQTILWKKLKYDIKRYINDLGNELNEFSVHRSNRIIKLSSMYVEIKLLDKIISESYFFDFPSNPEILEYLMKRNPKALIRKRIIEDKNYKTIFELIKNHNKLIVLGQPGSGKTTILRKIVVDIANDVGVNLIPLYVPLRSSILKEKSMKEFIQQQFENYGIENANFVITRLLEKGKLILLYDGIDEIIGSPRQRILEEINTISIEYPLNTYVATSRISSYHGELTKFKEVEMCELTMPNVTTYINNWFQQTEQASKLIEKIKTSPQIAEIANSPLLLSLICLVYEFDLEISSRRSSLYKRCIECLMRDWDSQRNFSRESRFSKLDDSKRISILSNLAYNLHSTSRIYFEFETIEKYLSDVINKYGLIEEDISSIIEEIIDHYGLIIEVSKGVYSFSHLTFQEYFAATYMSEKRLFMKEGYVFNHHPFWEEVNILCSATLPDATEYLIKLLENDGENSENIILAGLCLSVDPVVDKEIKEVIARKLLNLYHNYETIAIHERAKYAIARVDDTFIGNALLTSLGINKYYWKE